jgi:hypothetical protein
MSIRSKYKGLTDDQKRQQLYFLMSTTVEGDNGLAVDYKKLKRLNKVYKERSKEAIAK